MLAKQTRVDAALGCPLATGIKGLLRMLAAPSVHQGVARPAVKTQDAIVQNREVGDAANIQYRNCLPWLSKCGLVKGGEPAEHLGHLPRHRGF